MADVQHNALTGTSLHGPFQYEQDADPGAVGAGKYWLDTNSGPPRKLYRRNAGDTGWDEVGPTTAETLPATIVDAKGDLIAGSAADTPVRLAVGADDTILMADSGQTTGLKWVASQTPSTQAFADAAAQGTADTFARGDHKHAMPADPVTAHAAAADPHTGYVLESLIDAAGDLIVGTADNTVGRLAKGSDGQVLTVDPTTHLLVWATPAGGGSSLTVAELDGTPSGTPTTLQFPNGTVTDQGSGVYRYTPATGGSTTPAFGVGMSNGTLVASVSGNALTVAVKTLAGADPSSGDPVTVLVRSATAANGDYTALSLTAATSFVVSSGSTLGTANATASRLWVVAFNDAGTLRLGIINCRSGTGIYPLAGWGIASSTAEGGAGAADAAQTFYTGTAVSSKAYVVLGSLTYESGPATAGTWSAAPDRVQLLAVDSRLPGDRVQTARNFDGGVATTTTQIPADDTIPQSTEGGQFMSQAITPTSAANLLEVDFGGMFGGAGVGNITVALFQDSTANALAAMTTTVEGSGHSIISTLHYALLAATTSSTTLKLRAGLNGAGTLTFNGFSSARALGGVLASFLEVREVMA